MKNLKIAGVALGAIGLLAAVFLWLRTPEGQGVDDTPSAEPSATKSEMQGRDDKPARKAVKDRPERKAPALVAPVADEQDKQESEPEPEMTEEEKKEAEEEKRVEDFDSTVDKWMESGKDKVVTMADVDAFRELFRKVPKARKEECVHRALNLIPDDNVMLLAGILFDKEQDKEILNLVYNDILNRDEDVKKPILKEVFKDREHPNWADTAWILEVTGELPANEQDK